MANRCVVFLALSACGCSFLLPGLDTRMAMQSKVDTTWDAEGNLAIAENTTSETDTLMVEGDNVTVEWSPEGTPLKLQGATQVLRQTRNPREAAGAYVQLATENAKVAGQLIGLGQQIADALIPMLAARSRAPPATTQPVTENETASGPGRTE